MRNLVDLKTSPKAHRRLEPGIMKTKSRPPGTERGAKIKNVIRVSSGNFLEMYDFIVFGFFAGPIGRTFFPGHNPYASLGGKTSEVATTEYFGSWHGSPSLTASSALSSTLVHRRGDYHLRAVDLPTASRITSGSNWRHLNSPE